MNFSKKREIETEAGNVGLSFRVMKPASARHGHYGVSLSSKERETKRGEKRKEAHPIRPCSLLAWNPLSTHEKRKEGGCRRGRKLTT